MQLVLFVVDIDDADSNDTRQLLLAVVDAAISLIKACTSTTYIQTEYVILWWNHITRWKTECVC